jgi:meso-butanediol dehydrogenase/(S,S)-butanediol dehydrogenase/diacetyl reductase
MAKPLTRLEMPGLANLRVIVTGAGQGIGLGLAQHFAAVGARLVVADINAEAAEKAAEALRAEGAQAVAVAANVASPHDCEAMVATAVQAYGGVDVMVCNAGIVQVKPFMELTVDDWGPMLDINVKGTFLSIQAAARQMLLQPPLADGRPRGKIINMASIAGRYGGGPMAPFLVPYRASKAAVISLTQSAACALSPDITVNAVCPGLVATDMWKRMDRDLARIENGQEGEAFARRVSAVPMGRAQSPDDVAGVVLFLASQAADYMTGQSVNVDGGLVLN